MRPSYFISVLQAFFIIIATGAFLFSAWILWHTPLYGDDLWHLSSLRTNSFLDLLTKPVFGDSNHIPVFHLWMWFVSFFPLDYPWMHGIQAILLLLTCVLLHFYLWQMEIPSWIRWMVTALFLTTPTIGESIYWTSGTHLWLGCIWILLALIFLPRTSDDSYFWRWCGTFAGILLAMMTTELLYGFCVLFIGLLGLKYRKNPRVFSGCLITALLMIGMVAYRNHLVTGNWLQLSLDRDINRVFLIREIYISLYEILAHTHPLPLLEQFSRTYFVRQRLSEGWLFFHLCWYTLIWFIILQRKGRNGWDLLLLTFVTPLMIVAANALLYERYLIATIIGNVMALGLFVDCFSKTSWKKLYPMLGMIGVLVTILNFHTSIQRTIKHWGKDGIRYQNIIELVKQEHPDKEHTIGLVDSLSKQFSQPKKQEWWAAPSNTLFELQLVFSNMNLPSCIYDLHHNQSFEGYKYRSAHTWSVLNLKESCRWPPQELRCFKYHETGMLAGEFRPYQGKVKFAYLPDEDSNNQKEIPVTCL
ncbi:MAG: hypothetical protein HQM14_13360 [SAR324 cluster bacterium]|nr:hypothetical protein [SAR324 cluster bacterium]